MAVSFSTSFALDTVYTHELQSLSFSTTTTRLRVSLYRYDANTDLSSLIFQSTYATVASQLYAAVQKVAAVQADLDTEERESISGDITIVERSSLTVYDYGSIIEQWMETQGSNIEQCRIVAENALDETDAAECTLWVVYCRQRLSSASVNAEALRLSQFLHTRPVRLTYPSAEESLYFWNSGRMTDGYIYCGVLLTAQCRLADGTIAHFEHNFRYASADGVQRFNASPAEIRTIMEDDLPADSTLLSYSVNIGNRTCRFYVASECAYRSFYFRNAYYCPECIHIPTTRTRQLKTQSSSAQCDDTLSQYDIRHTRTYQEQTPVLSYAEALHFEELLTSPSVWLLINGTTVPILITDYSFEVSDTPAAETRLQFEWQFSNQRQAIPLSEPSRIFTTEYEEQFQ